ncbi:hypothetical protein HMI54_011504 [Coelomomyces lativittatus]|nr:hypothetical protein HMI54_011504 [Coelomomyces lativittatus]KAJ1505871.1 hypothetical protein HMI56_000896 [Coelomomyces lativittatus]
MGKNLVLLFLLFLMQCMFIDAWHSRSLLNRKNNPRSLSSKLRNNRYSHHRSSTLHHQHRSALDEFNERKKKRNKARLEMERLHESRINRRNQISIAPRSMGTLRNVPSIQNKIKHHAVGSSLLSNRTRPPVRLNDHKSTTVFTNVEHVLPRVVQISKKPLITNIHRLKPGISQSSIKNLHHPM